MSTYQKIMELQDKKISIQQSGGQYKIDKQHKSGKLTARGKN